MSALLAMNQLEKVCYKLVHAVDVQLGLRLANHMQYRLKPNRELVCRHYFKTLRVKRYENYIENSFII